MNCFPSNPNETASLFNRTKPEETLAKTVEKLIYTKFILIVCVFGLAGNLLNLLVLSRKSLTYSMERMEKSAHYGLMGLAVSDMLVCVAILPNVFLETGSFAYDNYDFRLFYRVYGQAIINTFILASTWLTVTMATSRYVAICYPLKARQFIGRTFAIASLVVVFLVCSLFNVPRFLKEAVSPFKCPNGAVVYFPYPVLFKTNPVVETVYQWIYFFFFGILIPLAVLIFCNAHLSLALRRSTQMRTDTSTANRNSHVAHRITLTLIVIVVMYVILFVPAEMLNFFGNMATRETTDLYNVTVAIFNLLQAINFAFNFILYCAINTHFRRTVYSLFACRRNIKMSRKSIAASIIRQQWSMTEASMCL